MVSNIMSNPFMLAEASLRQDHLSNRDQRLKCKDYLAKPVVQPPIRRNVPKRSEVSAAVELVI